MDRMRPHTDKARKTTFGVWMTACRLKASERQCDLALVLGTINPNLANQGRVMELETGRREPTPEMVQGLYAHFRDRLGDTCPPPAL